MKAPSIRDFLQILSFLLRRAIPNFADFGTNMEEGVPAVFSALGYPYPITSAQLKAVGTQHAWPQLLAALAWLVDLLKYSEAASDREAGDSFDNDDGNKVFFDYLTEGYKQFLSGADDLTHLDEQLRMIFDQKSAALQSDIAALQQANGDMSLKLETLTVGPTPLQQAQKQHEDLCSDKTKLENHSSVLREYEGKLRQRLEADRKESLQLQEDLAKTNATITAHKETISKQELTPADILRMSTERQQLEESLSLLKQQKDALNNQLWDEETHLGKTVDRLETKVQQSNNNALRLQMIPADAKNAGGVSHQVELQRHLLTSAPDRILSVDVGANLKPALQRLRSAFVQELRVAHDKLLEAEEAEKQREDDKLERVEELANLKSSYANLEREEKLRREQHARELEERNMETEGIREKIHRSRAAKGQSVAQSQAELLALQKTYEEFLSNSQHTREKMYNQLVSSLDLLTMHKDNVESQMRRLKDHIGAKVDQLGPLLAQQQ